MARQKGMHRRACWPGFIVGAKEPDSIGRESGGFSWACDLNRSVNGLRRKQNLIGCALYVVQKLLPVDASAVEAKGARCIQCLLPATLSLEFNAPLRRSCRPANGLEQMGARVRP